MAFGDLFVGLAQTCAEKAVPRLQEEVLRGGGTLPLHAPGPLFIVSLIGFVMFQCWYLAVVYMYPFHVHGLAQAMKHRDRAIATYRVWSTWKWIVDIRRTVIPAAQFIVASSALYATWCYVAFQRQWWLMWTPIETYCHPTWMALYWMPALSSFAYLPLFVASGMGLTRPWYARHIRRLFKAEHQRLQSHVENPIHSKSGLWSRTWRFAWFHVRYTYYAMGGVLGLLVWVFFVWLAHDALLLTLTRVEWDVTSATQDFKQSLHHAYQSWMDVLNAQQRHSS